MLEAKQGTAIGCVVMLRCCLWAIKCFFAFFLSVYLWLGGIFLQIQVVWNFPHSWHYAHITGQTAVHLGRAVSCSRNSDNQTGEFQMYIRTFFHYFVKANSKLQALVNNMMRNFSSSKYFFKVEFLFLHFRGRNDVWVAIQASRDNPKSKSVKLSSLFLILCIKHILRRQLVFLLSLTVSEVHFVELFWVSWFQVLWLRVRCI